jgi:hypothetical protein
MTGIAVVQRRHARRFSCRQSGPALLAPEFSPCSSTLYAGMPAISLMRAVGYEGPDCGTDKHFSCAARPDSQLDYRRF